MGLSPMAMKRARPMMISTLVMSPMPRATRLPIVSNHFSPPTTQIKALETGPRLYRGPS
jgi:hypothetical protein